MNTTQYVRWLDELSNRDVALVGGKNASLGEMLQQLSSAGVQVPGGFATTAAAYWAFVRENELDTLIADQTQKLDRGERSLQDVGETIRQAFRQGSFPQTIAHAIRETYHELSRRHEQANLAVAIRSSATAEDLPEASFAGQQETYLNIQGADDVLQSCRDCFASLFTNRAINYRQSRGFDHTKIALSVGVQKMVRSDLAGAGVMFSLDTDTGYPHMVVINAAWGLGETVVQGTVNPDEYRVFKPKLGDRKAKPIIEKTLGVKEHKLVYANGAGARTKTVKTDASERASLVISDAEIMTLARWASAIERHYGVPMDMEWAKDGESGELFCLQARPETVHSQKKGKALKTYQIDGGKSPLATGVAIGQAIATGPVKVLESPEEMSRFADGDVLVTERTDPDWGPIMKRAAAIVTDFGGRTSHAAIVSRELGIPAVVGTGNATKSLTDGSPVTVSCAEGEEGRIYAGILDYQETEIDLENVPESPVRLMINLAAPGAAFRWWRLPVHGVGLARMEFIINNVIKIHPLALSRFDQLEDPTARKEIQDLTAGYRDKTEYFVSHLSRGIAAIAAAQYPDPVIVRMSDFKTNEYAQLIGGQQFEPHEENPMLGFRGASRYYSDNYKDGFALECRAVRRAREEIGLDNLVVMIPFVRTPAEADDVIRVMADYGLERGRSGLQLYMMCEVPSNVFLAEEFAERFDGFSIGSNDLTQLVLGIDRDSVELRQLFDERNEAVKEAIRLVIHRAHKKGCKVGICGQAPSDYPEFARFLVDAGIDSMSLNPDSVLRVIEHLTHTPKTTIKDTGT